jgi:hypothetical protein
MRLRTLFAIKFGKANKIIYFSFRTGLCAGGILAFRLSITAAKFINKNSLFILLFRVIRPIPKLGFANSLIVLQQPHLHKTQCSGSYINYY